MHKLRGFIPALILFAGSALIWQTRSQRAVPLAAPLNGVLPAIDGYQAFEQKVSDNERQVAGMTDYVARAYARDSIVAFTTLVSYYDSQSQGKTIHSPRNCLPGAGWEILSGERRIVTADGVGHSVNRYALKNGPAMAIALYWYQGRGRVVASEYAVKWNLLRDAALLGHTEEALVRVVVNLPTGANRADSATVAKAMAEADALGVEIAGRLMREVTRVLPAKPGEAPSRTRTASLAP